jgi:putative Holliday junction resolvase
MSTIIAFDFGLKRIGVAVGNTLLRQATPRCLAAIDASSWFAAAPEWRRA